MKITLNLELWKRQLECLTSPATEILFGGATEGGKSHLARVALISWCLAIPNFQCVLIRKKFDSIAKNHVEGPTGFKALLAPLIQAGAVKILEKGIRFPNGSNIDFEHCQDERQFDKAQGIEKHAIVIDEATQISERLIRFFRGWCRMTPDMQAQIPDNFKGMFPRILYTANPIGPSVGFFRRHFVKARPAFAIEEIHGFKRQYIPSRATDNKSVDLKAHHGRLAGIGDDALAKALDEGDWDAPIGDFIREYDESRHVVPDFEPPQWWYKYRAFDWGHAEPFAVGWYCVSDGEEFEYNGKTFWFPAGAVVMFKEWYGCREDNQALGLRLTNKEIAKGIRERSEGYGIDVTLTDSKPFQSNGGIAIEREFADEGVQLILADTKRISGWSILKNRLRGVDGFAMFYLTESCKYAREYLPSLQRHATKLEDAVEDGEATHMSDCCRYSVNARPPTIRQPEPIKEVIEPNTMTFNDALEMSNRRKNSSNDY